MKFVAKYFCRESSLLKIYFIINNNQKICLWSKSTPYKTSHPETNSIEVIQHLTEHYIYIF